MKKNKKNLISLIPYFVVVVFLMLMLFSNPISTTNTSLTYNEFNELLEGGNISEAKVSVDYNTMTVAGTYEVDGKVGAFSVVIPNTEETANSLTTKLTASVKDLVFVDANESNVWVELLGNSIPLVLFIIVGTVLMNKMGAVSGNKQAFDFSKSKARLEKDIKVKFDDVAGCDEEKEEMQEIIEYLKSPKKFAKMGA